MLAWVDHVDGHVRLKGDSAKAQQRWMATAASCGGC